MASSDDKEHSGSGLDSRFSDKILDRIAELAKGNEDRTLEYLNMKTDGFERQKKLREKRHKEGLKRAELWVNSLDLESLKTNFPGPKGGIDWNAVIKVALSFVTKK